MTKRFCDVCDGAVESAARGHWPIHGDFRDGVSVKMEVYQGTKEKVILGVYPPADLCLKCAVAAVLTLAYTEDASAVHDAIGEVVKASCSPKKESESFQYVHDLRWSQNAVIAICPCGHRVRFVVGQQAACCGCCRQYACRKHGGGIVVMTHDATGTPLVPATEGTLTQ